MVKRGLVFAFVVLALALAVGRLFLQASAASDEQVKVVVYVKDAPQAAHGFRAAAVRLTSESVLESIPKRELAKERRLSSINGFTATVSRAYYERLKANPNVEVFEEQQLHVLLDASAPLVGAAPAHGLVYNGSNVTGSGISVCVIDTGINYSHAALGGCSQSSFLAGTCAKVPGGFDFVSSDSDPYDDHGHGSHVSGIVASTDDTYPGVAPNASIVAIKVCNSGGSCSSSDIISGIDWCVSNASRFNISVISMSLGGESLFSTYCDGSAVESANAFARPIDSAVINNISVVVASGNDGSTAGISSPACIRNATSVGSTTEADAISSFSNRNDITDLLAPGSSITSVDYNGDFEEMSGTSMATPHVAGSIALLAQYTRLTSGRNVSPAEAFLALNTTGVNLTDTGGSGIKFARIEVYDALLYLDREPPNLTYVPPTLSNNSNSRSTSVFVNITGSEVLQNASLEWSNATHTVNYSMNGSGLFWFRNHSSISLGTVTYRVWGNDSSGNWGVAETRTVRINNTAPTLASFLPVTVNVSINEPGNQTFNITYSDAENDNVTVDWYVNGTIQPSARNTNFTFLGNFTQASHQFNGTYNITAAVSDGNLSSQLNWTLTVNNTNRAPEWAGIANQSSPENVPFSFVVTAADLDNDTITYSINNTINFTINPESGAVTFNLSGAGNFSGVFFLALNASDGLANVSQEIFVNITFVNQTPLMFPLSNVTVNVTDFVNITLVADDAENDVLNFTINDTARFNLTGSNRSAANFSWKTNISSSGAYQFLANVTDFGSSSVRFFNVTVVARADFDGDGVPDIYDADIDNDGIANEQDSVLGNISTINSSTMQLSNINVMINSSANVSRLLAETLLVNITNGSRSLVEFYWNFSVSNLSLNFTVDVQGPASDVGYIIVKGLVLQQSQTKNITLNRVSGTNSVCIKDADVSSISSVSSGCNGDSETLISCPGAAGNYTCSLVDGSRFYMITNVSFTAAKEQPASLQVTTVTSSSGGGGGGGGGGGAASNTSSAKAAQFFASVKNGETAVMKINRSGIPFTKLSFTAASHLSSVNFEVEAVNESKVEQKLEAADVYKYVKVITKPELLNVSAAGIEFKVLKSWLSKDASLFRQSGASWERMETAFFGEDGEYYYYSAELPGFSLFAIAAERQKPASRINESGLPVVVPQPVNETVPVARAEPVPAEGLSARRKAVLAVAALVSAAFASIFVHNLKRRKEQDEISKFLGRP